MKTASKTTHLPDIIAKMETAGLPPIAIKSFAYYYDQILSGSKGLIPENEILPVDPSAVVKFDQLQSFQSAGRKAMSRAVKIILNGGLGTSMGLLGPKSLLKVKNNHSFLEILLRQAELAGVKLALMNSFSTHDATQKALTDLSPADSPLLFRQHMFPKVLRHDLAPAHWPQKQDLEWNPPGHGDIFIAMQTSGILDRLLSNGIRYALITNVDNLGATMDESLLGLFADRNLPFMMEVAIRSPADNKGGHLAYTKAGRFLLREIAQCHEKDLPVFQDIQHHCFFNTNSLWINLESLREAMQERDFLPLPLILNPKTLDPRDENSPAVYQVETAMGAAISLFKDSIPVHVPPERFLPVKKCNDLLAIRSDCYYLDDQYRLQVNPERRERKIEIDLDPKFYTKIDELNARFPFGPPSLVDCRTLRIKGDVRFEKDVIIRGDVRIENRGLNQATVKPGTVIEKDLIF